MKRKRVTNKDIAEAAGVSPTAVSFALNGREGISSETRANILEVAERMGYTVSPTTRNLNIALLFRSDLHQLDQLFYTELNSIFMDICKTQPYNLIMVSAYRKDEDIIFSDILHSGTIDGIVAYGDPDTDILLELNKLSIPYVVLDCSRRSNTRYAIRVDYKEAAYKAACHLIEKGHRDIAYIGNNSKILQDFNLLTFAGFQKATTVHNIVLGTNRIQLDITDEASLYRGIDRALEGENRPTALFCTADYYAILAIRHLHSIGIRVPEDISVIGIDDVAISQYFVPSLTTVRIDREEISRKGLDLLIRLINREPAESITLASYEVIERESVGAPAK